MTVFFLTGHFSPNISPLAASAMSVHILGDSFSHFSPVSGRIHAVMNEDAITSAADQFSECKRWGVTPLSLNEGAGLGPFPFQHFP